MKLKTASIVFFLLLLANFSQGQTKNDKINRQADSLATIIAGKDCIEKIDALNLLSAFIFKQNLDSGINMANQAIKLSEELEYKNGLAKAYLNLGDIYHVLDSLEPTMTNYLKALRLYEDLPPSNEYGNLLMQLGWINIFQDRDQFAWKYMIKGKSIFEKTGDEMALSGSYFGLGRAKTELGEYDSAFYYLSKGIEGYDSTIKGYAWDFNAFNLMYSEQFYETRDTSYLRLGISMLEKPLNWPSLDDNLKVTLYIELAKDYKNFNTDKHWATSLEYLEMANSLADSSILAYENKDQILSWMAVIYNLQGNYHKAIELSKQSIRMTEERLAAYSINQHPSPLVTLNNKFNHKVNNRRVYYYLYDSYAKLGDYKQALEYFMLSKQAGEEIFKEENRNLMTMMEVDSKDEKTKSHIDLLARDNELKALAIKQSRTLNFRYSSDIRRPVC